MEWDEEQKVEAQKKVLENSQQPMSDDDRVKLEIDANKYWDSFYSKHQNRYVHGLKCSVIIRWSRCL